MPQHSSLTRMRVVTLTLLLVTFCELAWAARRHAWPLAGVAAAGSCAWGTLRLRGWDWTFLPQRHSRRVG